MMTTDYRQPTTEEYYKFLQLILNIFIFSR